MGLFLSSGHFWFAAGSLFGAGKAVLRPVACDQVRGARGAMMTCDRGFLHSFSVWTVPVGLLRIRGELATGAHLRATDLYTVGSFDPDHDAVMRIGGEAPGGGPILSVGIKCQVRIRLPATSDRQFGSRAEPA